MGEIHALPVRLDHEGAKRLSVALMEAYSKGADLGPRGPHIHVLALSLENHLEVLYCKIERLAGALDQTDPAVAMMKRTVSQLIAEVEGMITLCEILNP